MTIYTRVEKSSHSENYRNFKGPLKGANISFFHFCPAAWLVGYQFHNQRLNLAKAVKVHNPNP